MPLSIGDVIQVSYRSLWKGQRIIFGTQWAIQTTTSSATDMQDLDSIAGAFTSLGVGQPLTAYLTCLGTDVTVEEVRAQRVQPNRTIFRSASIGSVGTGTAAAETGNLAAAMIRKTTVAGRNQYSLSHIGPMPTGAVAGGNITTAYTLTVGLLASRFLSPVSITGPTIGLIPVIFHSKAVAAPFYAIPSQFAIQATVRTMHRRTLFVGE